MKKYITIQGDTWDSIAYDLYGDENYMSVLMEANFDYVDTLKFPANVELNVPEIGIEIENDTDDQPDWRNVETDSDEDDLFSEDDLEADLEADSEDEGEEDSE